MQKNLQHQPTSPQRLTQRERRLKVLDLRKQHFSLRDIAKAINTSHQTVKNDLDKALKELCEAEHHKAAEYRMIELQRLERVSHHVLSQALAVGTDGKIAVNLQAVEEYRRLSESRRKLLGLDAPVQHEVGFRNPEELDFSDLTDEELLAYGKTGKGDSAEASSRREAGTDCEGAVETPPPAVHPADE